MTHDEVIQHLQGGQVQWCHITSTFKGLEMRAMWLFSHIYIKRIGHSDACEPWGYVAPVVAAFVMRATGVRHIYLIYERTCVGVLGREMR